MPKRARGKSAQKLKKRQKHAEQLDESLTAAPWRALNQVESDDEFDYENQPRSFKVDDDEVERLPVKINGQIQRVVEKPKSRLSDEKDEDEDEDEDEEEDDQGSDDESVEEDESSSSDEEEKQVDETSRMVERQLIQTKERIADVAEQLNEDPEENIGLLKGLREMIQTEKSRRVRQLVLIAMIPVFKGLIPGYRIRPLTEAEQREKVSKEVKKLRNFEQSLIANYKAYVNSLRSLSRKWRNNNPYDAALGASALAAACELIEMAPHFNFRDDLIQIVVERVGSRKVDETFNRCIACIKSVFRLDEEGHVSFAVVRLLAKMFKARKYNMDEAVLNTLLELRLLTELQSKADLEKVEKEKPTEVIKKKDRVALSKKQRKMRKEQKAIDEEMRKAETAVSAEERERIQGETLKIVFILYFKILKERSPSLMSAALEGLAKFAHLINADFFGDLLEVLRELVNERQKRLVNGEYEFRESATREALLCIVTAFALLDGQAGESMNLDLSFFVNHFYSSLYAVALNPDVELSHKTLRLDDPLEEGVAKRPAVNIATEMEMVVRIFEAIFLRRRNTSKLRAEAFSKRLTTGSLHLPEKSSIASLKILHRMITKFNGVKSLFTTEDRVANGVYHPEADVPEHSNPEAATIWETALLGKHYSPKVSQAAQAVLRSSKDTR